MEYGLQKRLPGVLHLGIKGNKFRSYCFAATFLVVLENTGKGRLDGNVKEGQG